jgi:hypothetical protein
MPVLLSPDEFTLVIGTSRNGDFEPSTRISASSVAGIEAGEQFASAWY